MEYADRTRDLGTSDTAVQAALAYARAKLEIAAREFVPPAPPAPPPGLVEEAEGVRLHLSGKSATGYKGVSLQENGRFHVRARLKGSRAALGTYDTVVQAALAYARAKLDNEDDWRLDHKWVGKRVRLTKASSSARLSAGTPRGWGPARRSST